MPSHLPLFPPSYRWRWYHRLIFETAWACVCGVTVIVWVGFKVMGALGSKKPRERRGRG